MIIYVLGYLALVCMIFRTIKSFRSTLYVHVLAKYFGQTINFPSYGKWAVITGSTDGIGKGYASALAQRGMSIFLISRNSNKLENTAKEIRNNYSKKIEVRTLAFDFKASTVEEYAIIKEALSDLEIGVLVNNVGINTECPDYFDSYSGGDKFWKNMIDVNCTSFMEMTYIVLPQMLKRGKGIIINMSSLCGFIPMPLQSVYSGTKVFIRGFTHGLIGEYAKKGIILQTVHPYLVATKMIKKDKGNLVIPDPLSYAQSALDTVGLENETTGCLSHAVQHALMQFVPNYVSIFCIKRTWLMMRRNFLAKKPKSG